MKLRAAVVTTVLTLRLVAPPSVAAQEAAAAAMRGAPASFLVAPAEDVARGVQLGLTTADAVALSRAPLSAPFLTPSPREIRLSSEAKTAIIIGAIVVGVLVIVGVASLAKPGKKLP